MSDLMQVTIGEQNRVLITPQDHAEFEQFYASYMQFGQMRAHFFGSTPLTSEVSTKRLGDPGPQPRKRPAHLPPIGERTIDYLLRAVSVSENETLLLKTAQSVMFAQGWKTQTQNPATLTSTIQTAYRRHPEWISVKDGQATLTEAGKAFLQSLPVSAS